jgi:tRNA (guanine-N7-)-methyltransferase
MPGTRSAIDVSSYLIDPTSSDMPAPINWAELFRNEHPVELEIGSGKGLFLLNSATSETGHNFLGVELARKYARLAAERLARRQLGNAKIWRGDARLIIGRLVPESSLRAVHVYFPDPWWKKRHKKRRVFSAELVAQIGRALEPGGRLRVASDVEEYFLLIQRLISADPRFRPQPVPERFFPQSELRDSRRDGEGPSDPIASAGSDGASPSRDVSKLPVPGIGGAESELDYLTNFERKYRIEGRPIFRAHYILEC